MCFKGKALLGLCSLLALSKVPHVSMLWQLSFGKVCFSLSEPLSKHTAIGPIRAGQRTSARCAPSAVSPKRKPLPENRSIKSTAVRVCSLSLTVVNAPRPAIANGSSNWSWR